MRIETKIKDQLARDLKTVHVHDRDYPTWEARLACLLIERWGTVAAQPDGEDSAGRAKLRLSTPAEVVNRACETAASAIDEFRSRGWVIELPSLADLSAKDDAA